MSSNWINQSTDTERILQELVEISQNLTSDNVVRYRMLQEELLHDQHSYYYINNDNDINYENNSNFKYNKI